MLQAISSSWAIMRRDSLPQATPYDVVAGSQAVDRSSVASLAFLAWDIIITFEDEVKVIWRNPWSPMKVLYFIIRYLSLSVQISTLFAGSELTPALNLHFTHHDCYIWAISQGVGAAFVIISADVVLILRVHALYHCSKVVQRLLWVLYLGECLIMALGLKFALPQMEYDSICRVTKSPTVLSLVAVAPIIFQTILFVLTGIKFVQAVRAGWGHIPLVIILMRDGTWAFFLLFVLLLGDMALYIGVTSTYASVLYGWVLTFFSFCGYRILLNINDLNQRKHTNSNISHRTNFTTDFWEDPNCVDTQTSS
ncbi:hypothetical protein BDN72DRAFT_126556 [Pluteus cervinus]|uniref:Uncharacterized protein n=1 Tax=Pluteus cervinus TaxID=181527 RepID=A0ACD3ALU4_9AGAR|nr:hypothetical protein BDN72DRAFT_126556 [Pluteus cervinus]